MRTSTRCSALLDTAAGAARQRAAVRGGRRDAAADRDIALRDCTSAATPSLLEQTRTLDTRASDHGSRWATRASMGSHLRFGFEATYGRDTVNMRNDNVADYPWLCFALATLMQEYARMHAAGEHEPARASRSSKRCSTAFQPTPARSSARRRRRSAALGRRARRPSRRRFHAHQADLLHGVRGVSAARGRLLAAVFLLQLLAQRVKGTVIDALLTSGPGRLTFNDLLTSLAHDDDGHPRRRRRWPRR